MQKFNFYQVRNNLKLTDGPKDVRKLGA